MKDQWIEWLQAKQRHFFYGVTIIVACFFVAFQAFGKFYKGRPHSYLTVNQAFESWMSQDGAFEKLEEELTKHPEMASKFGARIAHELLAKGQVEMAEPFAQGVFNRVFKQTPEHTAFSEGSLLIQKGEFTQALQQSVALSERLDQSSLLYGFNLVRIASLFRALNDADQELAALEDLEGYIESHEKEANLLTRCFQEGSLTLSDYISERKSFFDQKN